MIRAEAQSTAANTLAGQLASFTHTHGRARKNEKLLEDAENYRQDAAYLAVLLR